MVVCGGKVLSKPYPTPRLGISAPQAVSKISGCGGGAPYPIGGAEKRSAHVKTSWHGVQQRFRKLGLAVVRGFEGLSRFGVPGWVGGV